MDEQPGEPGHEAGESHDAKICHCGIAADGGHGALVPVLERFGPTADDELLNVFGDVRALLNGDRGEAVQQLAGAVFQEVSRSGLPGRDRAVLVTGVKPESPAYRHGLRPGDLIIGVNSRRVTSVKELTAALRTRGGVQLNVLRGDNMLSIPVS